MPNLNLLMSLIFQRMENKVTKDTILNILMESLNFNLSDLYVSMSAKIIGRINGANRYLGITFVYRLALTGVILYKLATKRHKLVGLSFLPLGWKIAISTYILLPAQ